MSSLENELKELREQNNDLVQKVQYWKMTAAQKDNEKLKLMKEASELRLKLSTLRSNGTANARKLYAALQTASEEALSHLVQASNNMARVLEIAKSYMQDRENIDYSLPHWSNLSMTNNTPSKEKVHRVPPLLLGGKSLQPVVSLSRTLLENNSGEWSGSGSSNVSRNGNVRAMPMHMLQDVYIPLTRIDAGELASNNVDMEEQIDNSAEDLGLDDSDDRINEENISGSEDLDESRKLDAVTEEPEELTPHRSEPDNPLEGPSWLLDESIEKVNVRRGRKRMSVEPDIMENQELGALTQEHKNVEVLRGRNRKSVEMGIMESEELGPLTQDSENMEGAASFSPTVRRRAARSPVLAPRPRHCNNGRILKVLVSKMRLEDDVHVSPPKRQMKASTPEQSPQVERHSEGLKRKSRGSPETGRGAEGKERAAERCAALDAPSPNGATDARLVVMDARAAPSSEPPSADASVASAYTSVNASAARGSRRSSSDASDSSTDMLTDARTRRARKPIVYKEKPLNRKLRR